MVPFCQVTKQRVTALSFFLRVDDQKAAYASHMEEGDSSSDEEEVKGKDILAISKKELDAIKKKEGKGVRRCAPHQSTSKPPKLPGSN